MKTKNNTVKHFFKALGDYIVKAKIELIIIIVAIALDLITKAIVQANMQEGDVIEVIPNFLNWYYTLNNKAGFGWAFGLEKYLSERGIMIFFIVITFIALVFFGFMLYLFRNKRLLVRVALSFIIGGAIGNLVDRISFGYVRDFIQIVYFGLDLGSFLGTTFATFNIADAFLTVGVFLFAIYVIFFMEEKTSKQPTRDIRQMTTAELNGIMTESEEDNKKSEEDEKKGENIEEPDSSRNG